MPVPAEGQGELARVEEPGGQVVAQQHGGDDLAAAGADRRLGPEIGGDELERRPGVIIEPPHHEPVQHVGNLQPLHPLPDRGKMVGAVGTEMIEDRRRGQHLVAAAGAPVILMHAPGDGEDLHADGHYGDVVLDVRHGYPTYLRDFVDVVRGYEDPPGVMNFRSIKVDANDPPRAKLPGVEMRYLSMGMSASYRVAIEEGATMVRIGTALFGHRSARA